MFLIIILFIAFLFYKETLFYYFISDDFGGFAVIKNFLDLIKIDPANNHYSPVVKTIGFFLNNLFAFNPFPYHFYVIIVHLVNIYLVYSLSKIFIKNRFANLLSALIFAFFFANYEVVFWYGASNNLLLVTFYISYLIFLIKYISNQTKSFIFFQIFFVLAFFTHEYAISLIPVGIIYWWMFTNKKDWKQFVKLFSVPVLVVVTITILKLFIVQMPLTVRSFSIFKFIAFTLRSFVYLFIPNPYIVDKIPNIFIPIIFLIISFILLRLTKNKQTLFLLIWTGLTIFVYSITSAPQARYFYLSFIPVIIYILSIVKIKKAITVFYILFILVSGVVFLQNQKYYWLLSSQITKNVINDLKKYSPQLKNIETIYFVNLPDSINDSIWKAYVFRACFKELLNNFANIYPKKIVYLTSFKPTPHTIEAPYISLEKLLELRQKNVVFVYKENRKSVILVPSHPQGD